MKKKGIANIGFGASSRRENRVVHARPFFDRLGTRGLKALPAARILPHDSEELQI
jgi:hypothetical protein